MFLKRRKSREPSEENSSPQEGDAEKKNPDEDSTEAEDTPVNQVTNLEELIGEKPGDLEEADEDKDAPAQPHKPQSELTVEPGEEPPGEPREELSGKGEEPSSEDNDLSVLLGKDEEEEEKSDSLSDLFNQEEEEVNPLASLISSFSDVTASELLNEAQETITIIRETQQP